MESYSDTNQMDFPSSSVGNSSLYAEFNSYKKIQIENWSPENSVDWAIRVCQKKKLYQESAAAFNQVSGQDLLTYEAQDFCRLTNYVEGPIFYKEFCKFRQRRERSAQNPVLGESALEIEHINPSLTTHDPQFDLSAYLDDCTDDRNMLELPRSPGLHEFSDLDPNASGPSCSASAIAISHEKIFPKIKSSGHRKEGRRPWIHEFLMFLLKDPTANPRVIQWLDEGTGKFEIVQEDIVAHLWRSRSDGRKSNDANFKTILESFKRSLREHYHKDLEHLVGNKYMFTEEFLQTYRSRFS